MAEARKELDVSVAQATRKKRPEDLTLEELEEIADEVERARNDLEDAMTRAYLAGCRLDVRVSRQKNPIRADAYPSLDIVTLRPLSRGRFSRGVVLRELE